MNFNMILVTFRVMILLLSLCNHFFYFPNPTIVAGNHGYPWHPTECNFSCKPCYVNWNCCWVLCSYNACFLCKCIIFSKFKHIIFMNQFWTCWYANLAIFPSPESTVCFSCVGLKSSVALFRQSFMCIDFHKLSHRTSLTASFLIFL